MSADPQPAAGAVSGSVRADDALRETSAFQRAILECADYSIISTGPDGIIDTIPSDKASIGIAARFTAMVEF